MTMKGMSFLKWMIAFLLIWSFSENTGNAQEPDLFQLVGYATMGDGTTGGQGDPNPITVSTGEALYDSIKTRRMVH